MLLALALFACSTDDTIGGDTSDTGTLPTITAPPLVINEVLASNTTNNSDNTTEFDDWVEIYNNGDTILQLDGFYLSDDEAEKTLFALPAGVGIDAHGFIGIWCDGQPEQTTASEYHTSYKLDRKGDEVYLNYAEGNQIVTADSVYWEAEQTPDVSAARVPDGAENWVNQAPTFEASNGG
ncbi:hypothetical protein LBMAG42_47120 [Deltaproteobacteria bacterium]|nr:hypothetical protein LBMAG42_47120 [Deltaproteobacteria bacterium]